MNLSKNLGISPLSAENFYLTSNKVSNDENGDMKAFTDKIDQMSGTGPKLG